MFFKKKPKPSSEIKLQDLVKHVDESEYVFIRINNDLGTAVEDIMASTPMVQMTYAYARRSAMMAMYLQGVHHKDAYEYVQAMFKTYQQRVVNQDPAAQTVEFQERAFALSVEFMQTYNFRITSHFLKMVAVIIRDYEFGQELRSDAELFSAVIETSYQDEQASISEMKMAVAEAAAMGTEDEVADVGYEPAAGARPPEEGNRLGAIFDELMQITERKNEKTVTIWIQPLDEPWSLEVHHAEEDRDRTDELCSELHNLMKCRVQMSHFRYTAD